MTTRQQEDNVFLLRKKVRKSGVRVPRGPGPARADSQGELSQNGQRMSVV